MKRNIYFFLFLFFIVTACNNKSDSDKPENDLDAARSFIRATMDGDYKKARTLVVPDSANNQFLDVYERNYNERMKPEDKEGYHNASINMHDIKNVNDSVSIVSYSNSYFKKDTHLLKVVRINNEWLVDFKYYFRPKKDSLP